MAYSTHNAHTFTVIERDTRPSQDNKALMKRPRPLLVVTTHSRPVTWMPCTIFAAVPANVPAAAGKAELRTRFGIPRPTRSLHVWAHVYTGEERLPQATCLQGAALLQWPCASTFYWDERTMRWQKCTRNREKHLLHDSSLQIFSSADCSKKVRWEW